uniref:Si:dkey-219e21.2 n=1 Tax=Gasterosteus aculeatus aculeatus TaxID=481459 RepID=G3Q6U7_GASAC|nr:zinc-binding protein A33 isoform X1 [Gasterosteus aculeatus aculeatus]
MEVKRIKSILKTTKRVDALKLGENATRSSSIGAVRWTLPEEDVQIHSSAPSRATNNLAKRSQQHPRQVGLKDLRSLQECVQFIHHWKKQVDQVCKSGDDPDEGPSGKEPQRSDSRSERSLEESRILILEWADELHHVDEFLREKPRSSESKEKENKEDDDNEEAEQRIMDWAKELQKATESCGVESDELGKVLRQLGLKKKRLVNLLPLLEFITWSLLEEDSTKMVPQLWLLAKQRTWTAGTPRYIPNSVWSWIRSAAADVVLDPLTNHPWLQLSEDQRGVQEGPSKAELPPGPQRFDGWPCALGWEGYGGGRHFWEVDVAKNGYWRVGLTTAGSKRHGRFPMTPEQGYWVLWRSANHFYACAKPEAQLPVAMAPRRMGIYLDYAEGQISFYNAETKSHIYTFTGNFRGKLYPVFAPLDGRTRLVIQKMDNGED